MAKKTIAVWVSCGVASGVAAMKTVDLYVNTHNILLINNPVDEEDKDNYRFLCDLSKFIGLPIYSAINTKTGITSAVKIWDKKRYMSGVHGAPCTLALKKEARYLFEINNKIDWHVLGFTYDEISRYERFIKYERGNVIPVLIDLKLSKNDCFKIINNAGIDLPNIYKLGYPNANCVGCVKSQSPTYWNLVRKTFPDVFNERCEQSRRLGCKLVKVKGLRIFLDELLETEKGGKIKSYECGIFCDTK